MKNSDSIKNVSQKILAVMEAVSHIEKDSYNAFQKYNYVSEANLVGKVRQAMIDNKLIAIPDMVSHNIIPSGKDGDSHLTTVVVEYTFIDAESGEFITFTSGGQGTDKGDKGIFKALTGCNKYALLKAFQIATGDDPEADTGGSKSKKKPASKPIGDIASTIQITKLSETYNSKKIPLNDKAFWSEIRAKKDSNTLTKTECEEAQVVLNNYEEKS